jgi:hypothetical protein
MKAEVMETDYENGSWMKLAKNYVYWLVLIVTLQVNYRRVGWLVGLKFAEELNVYLLYLH